MIAGLRRAVAGFQFTRTLMKMGVDPVAVLAGALVLTDLDLDVTKLMLELAKIGTQENAGRVVITFGERPESMVWQPEDEQHDR